MELIFTYLNLKLKIMKSAWFNGLLDKSITKSEVEKYKFSEREILVKVFNLKFSQINIFKSMYIV